MKNLLLIITFLFSTNCFAFHVYPFELDNVFIDYDHYHDTDRDPLFYNSTKKESLSLNINTNILDFMFWDNRIHAETDNSQYHLIGLETRLGVRLFDTMEVAYHHHSQHILDGEYPYQRFPVSDSLNIRIYLYGNSHRPGMF